MAKVTAGAGLAQGPRARAVTSPPAPCSGQRWELPGPPPVLPAPGGTHGCQPRAPRPAARGTRGAAGGDPSSPGSAGVAPSRAPQAPSSYLGLVEDEPDEGGDQQGPRHGGAGAQLLVKVGERGGLLGQRHRVRVPHGSPPGCSETARGCCCRGGPWGPPLLGPAKVRGRGSGGRPCRSSAVAARLRCRSRCRLLGLTAPEQSSDIKWVERQQRQRQQQQGSVTASPRRTAWYSEPESQGGPRGAAVPASHALAVPRPPGRMQGEAPCPLPYGFLRSRDPSATAVGLEGVSATQQSPLLCPPADGEQPRGARARSGAAGLSE